MAAAFNLQALRSALAQLGQQQARPQMDYRYGVDDQMPVGGFAPIDGPAQAPVDSSWWRNSGSGDEPNPEMLAKGGNMFGGAEWPIVQPQPTPAAQPTLPQSVPQDPQDLASAYQENSGSPYSYAGPSGSGRLPGYDDAEAKLLQAISQPVPHQKWWKDALFKGGQIASNVYRGGWQGAKPEDLPPIIGFGRAKHNKEIDKAYGDYAPLRKLEDVRIADAYKKAQTENIYTDNETNREKVKAQKDEATQRRAGQALGRLTKLKYFDPNNAAHQRLAQEAGLDPTELQGWDDRNPFTKVVGGVTYFYDRQTRKFEPSNLPTDEAKTLTEYEVTMPDGEKRTYRVSQKDAAGFSTQMSALGAKLAQDDSHFRQRLTLDQQKFDQAKSEFGRVMSLRQQAETRQDKNAVHDYDEMITKMIIELEKSRTTGELTKEQYDTLKGMVGNITP